MNSKDALGAWIEGQSVGTLFYAADTGQFDFEYDAVWASSRHTYPLAPPLPFERPPEEADAIRSGRVRRFFENLLPEGDALEDAARAYKLSRTNLMGLMRVLGRESAGALCLVPAGTQPADVSTTRREISREELSERIRERAQIPFSVWDGRVRMSIAGLQDKVAVYRDDEGRIFLVEGALASTHLLKPAPRSEKLPHLVANEHFCMRLAGEVGVRAAGVEIMRVPEPLLVVTRFDRVRDAGRVRRIHIVDGCQALDLPPAYKYEHNLGSGRDVAHVRDGASYERLFALTRLAVSEAAARMALLRWSLFQFLIGNSDAHGKNISFFMRPRGLEVAPAYDLVSVYAYDHFETEPAMAIGDTFDLEHVQPYDWADFAKRCGIEARLMAREMRRLAATAPEKARALLEWEGYAEDERDFLGKVVNFVSRQAERLRAHAAEVPKIRREDL